ncbi:MAG: hypothetical protein P8L32_06575, partial [Paracoccaceae bacterium]|nr:hypothetical protein [Paracoccaceae bacterium]
MHVAIGGIKLKSKFGALRFTWVAMKSVRIARRSTGCIHASIFQKGDTYFALSVWETQADMHA